MAFQRRESDATRWASRAALRVALAAAALWLDAPAAVAAPFGLVAHAQYETFGYPDPDSDSPSWENFFAVTVESNGALTSTLTWQFEGRVVADDVHFTAGAYSIRNEGFRRPYLSLIVAELDYRPTPSLRLSVGKQMVRWSIFDGVQPANVMVPQDESDAFRRVEQGVSGFSAQYTRAGITAELVVVPFGFTPSRVPQGRWNIIQGDVVLRQGLPPARVDETQAGIRIGTHFGQLQTSLIGYVGRDTEPIFVPGELIFLGIVNGSPQFQAQIITESPRLRTGGFTASYPLGDRVLARTEVVYYSSPAANRDNFMHSAVGAEYALDDWRLVLNYMRDDQISTAPEEVTSQGERRFFQSFFFGEVLYDPGGRWRGRVRGGYDTNGEFLLFQPEVAFRIWRTVWAALSGELITADRASYSQNPISYFDSIRHEDRLGLRIEYDF